MAINRDSELFKKVVKKYWDYYRELEDEFLMTRRYVDFEEKNFTTYSVEYLKLYQAVCSEIDVIGKAMAQIADSSFKVKDKQNNIYKWWFVIQDEFLVTDGPFTPMNSTSNAVRIRLRDYKCALLESYEFTPWAGFVIEKKRNAKNAEYFKNAQGSDTPKWWREYNEVKHHRISINNTMANYEKANLGNVSRAFAALYILERALMDTVGNKDDLQTFEDFSRLFIKRRRYTSREMEKLILPSGLF